MRFQNKVCVVTGGANGIGKCIAEMFLREGAYVAVIDKDEAAGNRLEHEKLLFFGGDIGDKQTLERICEEVLARHTVVDCLVNNAMVHNGGLLSGCSYEDFLESLRVGVAAPYYLASLLKDRFAPSGAIVNISSTRERMSSPDTESYTAAKGGIGALTHALCISLAGKVRVNAICPGWIDTHDAKHSKPDMRQHPSGRIGIPQDIASMALYLCSEDAGFINGESITIDGGMTRQMIYHDEFGWTYSLRKE